MLGPFLGVCRVLLWASVGPFCGCVLGLFMSLGPAGLWAIWCACAGSIAFAMLPDGRSARAAGCGAAFLDGGCGYDLGTDTLALSTAMTA